MDEKKLRCPFTVYDVAVRKPHEGELYNPFTMLDELEPPVGTHIQGFDSLGKPCGLDQDPYRIVVPAGTTAPEQYEKIHITSIPSNILPMEEWLVKLPSIPQSISTPISTPPVVSAPLTKSIPTEPTESKGAADSEDAPDYVLTKRTDGYYIIPPKRSKEVCATNFIINLTEVQYHVRYDGSEMKIRKSICFEVVLTKSSKRFRMEIEYEKLKDIVAYVTSQVAEAIVYKYKKDFESELQTLLRTELADCPIRHVYETSGWVKLPSGKFAYISDNAIPPAPNISYKCGFSFANSPSRRDRKQIIKDANQILRLSLDRSKILIPFLWAHLASLWSLFNEAGYPPHALLFINGVSGSLKTAVSSLLFNFSGLPENKIPATFRDTSASMEVRMAQYCDRVLLIDDFCPPASSSARRVLDYSLEQLVRFYGDGVAKARTDSRVISTYDKRPKGLCAITGEDTAGSYSSRLRCLFLHVDKSTYDGKLLSWFQEAPYLWTEYMSLFVEWASHEAPNIIAKIQTDFPTFRAKASETLKERRLIDTFAWLAVTAEFVCSFFATGGGAFHLDVVYDLLMNTCLENEQMAAQSNPARIFAETLMTLYQRGDIRLGDVSAFEESPQEYLGAVHDGYWYLWPKETFEAVQKYYTSGSKRFPLGVNALWNALVEAGILIPTQVKSKGMGRVEFGTRVSFAGRPRLLKIDPRRIIEFTGKDE